MKTLNFLWIVICILYYFSERSIYQNLLEQSGKQENTERNSILFSVLKTGVLLAAGALHIPLFLLYLLVLMSYGITFWCMRRESRLHFIFWMNAFGIGFFTFHLISMAVVSLASQNMLKDVYGKGVMYMFSLLLTLTLLNLAGLLWKNKALVERMKRLMGDDKRFRQIILFEYYAIGYLLFDSIPFLFTLPYFLLSIFLIGSCILLLLQLFLFVAHTYQIVEKAHCEAEYYRLEEERAEHVKRQMILHKLAYIDSLTGAFTRRYAMEMLESMHKDQLDVTIAYIDINGLKKVNDTLGHSEGDLYLKQVANRLNESLSKSEILSRIGGDEFLIVSNSVQQERMKELLKDVNARLRLEAGEQYIPSFSYGVVAASYADAYSLDQLLKESDRRMYAHKTEFKKQGGRL